MHVCAHGSHHAFEGQMNCTGWAPPSSVGSWRSHSVIRLGSGHLHLLSHATGPSPGLSKRSLTPLWSPSRSFTMPTSWPPGAYITSAPTTTASAPSSARKSNLSQQVRVCVPAPCHPPLAFSQPLGGIRPSRQGMAGSFSRCDSHIFSSDVT